MHETSHVKRVDSSKSISYSCIYNNFIIMVQVFIIMLWLIVLPTDSQLIRPNYIYKKIIKELFDYHDSSSILLVHSSSNLEIMQDVDMSGRLLNIQDHFSKLFIRTLTMNIETFVSKIGEAYRKINRPLFVLLNDFDDTKEQFASLIAPMVDMSYPRWLIFFRDETIIEEFFSNIYIPFNCRFMISKRLMDTDDTEIVTEVYQIDRDGEIKEESFATLDANVGSNFTDLILAQRRNNLYGHELRVISFHDPPASEVYTDENNVTTMGGFFGGVMELLKDAMNCTIIYIDAGDWGSDDSIYSGIMGELLNGTADIIAAEVFMTRTRLDYLKFSIPLYSTKCRPYIRKPESVLLWDKFITPFAIEIWAAVGLLVLISTGTIIIIQYFLAATTDKIKDIDDCASGMHIFFDVIGSLCGQGMKMSVIDSIRIVHFAIHLLGVVILAAYSAALISSLAAQVSVKPFSNISGLLRSGNYRLGMVHEDYSFFNDSKDSTLHELFENYVGDEDIFDNYREGLDKLCSQKRYALLALDIAVLELEQSINCSVSKLNYLTEISIALAMRRDYPFVELINYYILLMRDSGILQRLLKSVWSFTEDKNEEETWTEVKITDVFSLFAIVVGTCMISVFFLTLERIIILVQYHKQKKQKRKFKRALKRIEKNLLYPISLPLHEKFI